MEEAVPIHGGDAIDGAVAGMSHETSGVSARRRVSLAVVAALFLAVVGAAGGFAVQWFVLSPSDGELRVEVAEVTPDGLTIVGEPTVTGRWVPSLERGELHWEVAPSALSAADVGSHLHGTRWDVEDASPQGTSTYLHATKGSMRLTVRVGLDDDRTEIGFTLGRRDSPVSARTAVALGAGLGALLGGALGWFGPRRRAQRAR